MISSLSQGSEACASVSTLCDLLGISRQGYYKHSWRQDETGVLCTSLLLYCQHVRSYQLPRAGMLQLFELCKRRYGEKMSIGRDRFFDLLRENGLPLRRRRRPRTTDSRHPYRIYPDLLNTSPKLRPVRFGELLVADITYVATTEGWAYLSLLTDAASRLIVGWQLHRTLDRDGPLSALRKAMAFCASHGVDLSHTIHHSDRGVQYCCDDYVKLLKSKGMRISMTQSGDPLDNALAERMNNTIKNGWLFDCENKSFNQVRASIAHAVSMYNSVRPHRALGMQTPMEAMGRLVTA